MRAGPRFSSMEMLTLSHEVEEKCTGRQRGGPLRYVKSGFENIGTLWLSKLNHTVSQFTLLASTKKGNKPDFHGAAGGEEARELYDHFFAKVQELYEPEKVKNGVFQAMMEVNIQNSGPVGLDYTSHDEVVTLEIDTNLNKGQDGNNKSGNVQGEHQQSKASADQEKGKVAESFQLPVELLD